MYHCLYCVVHFARYHVARGNAYERYMPLMCFFIDLIEVWIPTYKVGTRERVGFVIIIGYWVCILYSTIRRVRLPTHLCSKHLEISIYKGSFSCIQNKRCVGKHTLQGHIFPLFVIVNVSVFQWVITNIFQATQIILFISYGMFIIPLLPDGFHLVCVSAIGLLLLQVEMS